MVVYDRNTVAPLALMMGLEVGTVSATEAPHRGPMKIPEEVRNQRQRAVLDVPIDQIERSDVVDKLDLGP